MSSLADVALCEEQTAHSLSAAESQAIERELHPNGSRASHKLARGSHIHEHGAAIGDRVESMP